MPGRGRSGCNSATYVHSRANDLLGRSGMPKGSMPHSSSTSSSSYRSSHSGGGCNSDTYVHSRANDVLGRSGMPKGSMPHSTTHSVGGNSGHSGAGSQGTYKDTPRQPRSSASNGGKVYKDYWLSHKLGRVGKPLGSCPAPRKSPTTANLQIAYQHHQNNKNAAPDYDYHSVEWVEAEEKVKEIQNRKEEVTQYREDFKVDPKTEMEMVKSLKKDRVIGYKEIIMGKKLGSGGFGEVFFAKLKGSVVAVKKLKMQSVARQKVEAFAEEVKLLCELEHTNVVHFIGACIVAPNLAIVMEYMEMTVYHAIHVDNQIEFSTAEKVDMMLQMARGLEYLHKKKVAHCDVKPLNVMLDYSKNEGILVAKLTDFGLALMKNNADTSTSHRGENRRGFGTPRYSAPEVLNGNILVLEGLKKADIYSMSLVMFEVTCEEEPFASLNVRQLEIQVGQEGMTVQLPEKVVLDDRLLALLKACWSRKPNDRPDAAMLVKFFEENRVLFKGE